MIILCAWCNKRLGEKPPLEDQRETHGMCPDCFQTQRNALAAIRRQSEEA